MGRGAAFVRMSDVVENMRLDIISIEISTCTTVKIPKTVICFTSFGNVDLLYINNYLGNFIESKPLPSKAVSHHRRSAQVLLTLASPPPLVRLLSHVPHLPVLPMFASCCDIERPCAPHLVTQIQLSLLDRISAIASSGPVSKPPFT